MSDPDFYLKVGDTDPALEATLENPDGSTPPLSNSTVRFRMSEQFSDSYVVDTQATVQDPVDGVVAYDWSDGDTDTAGTYEAEFVVDYSGETGVDFAKDASFPNDGNLEIEILKVV